MSLILEALRRSEEERLRRSAPPLLAPPRRRPRRARRALPWLFAAALPAALALGWWSLRAPPPLAAPDPSPSPASEARGSEQAMPPPSAPPPAAPPATPPGSAVAAAPTESERPIAAPREGAAFVAPATPDPIADPALDPAERERLAELLGRARPAPPPAATPGTTEPEPPTPGATATTVAEGPPWLDELPYALRRQLPPLRASMVVAAADPAARFVLVQGERRREGEELAPGVRVVEIGGEALLLEFRGQRFRWRPRLP